MRTSPNAAPRLAVCLVFTCLIALGASACGPANDCEGESCPDTDGLPSPDDRDTRDDPTDPSETQDPTSPTPNVPAPEAGFTLSPESGEAPLSIRVTADFSGEGNEAVAYRYGDTGEYETDLVHTFQQPGTFVVSQRVTTPEGGEAVHEVTVEVTTPTVIPVRLSETDRSPYPQMELTEDRLGMEVIDGDRAGVRSDRAIQPESGMFYYEGTRLTDLLGGMYFGVVTASHALDASPGSDLRSVGVETGGSIFWNDRFQEAFDPETTETYGIVVDYRAANPTVHVIVRAEDPMTGVIVERIAYTRILSTVTEPLFAMVSGRRRNVGPQAQVNFGNDTTNFPFHYDLDVLLTEAGIDTADLTLGWGQTNLGRDNAEPELTVSNAQTVPTGTEVTLTATATDAEDGTLTESITWFDLSSPYATRMEEVGGEFVFTPTALGIHPIAVAVRDAHGHVERQIVDVTVTGTLPQYPSVQLEADAQSGTGIVVAPNGLSARWEGAGKYGIRANQGLLDGFQYFEMRRLGAPANQGGGLVIEDGNLDPYGAIDVPPSMSVNHSASIWRDLMSVADYDIANTEYYGFAVDYRGRHPIVYVITHDGTAREDIVAHVMTLDDVTVPVYPMLYGNPTGRTTGYDSTINFGATAFHYDPEAILEAAGYNVVGLEVGWGDANN